ncbi:MAG TPA: GNAT family N-acetyltransferase [Fervidobacterium sp.]|nr:GNAT family N-acetyltransferase [Fervidobacterium sp.]
MELKVHRVLEADDKKRMKIDEFILDKNTNGEFINTFKYLSYHPQDRFLDDSIYVEDENSGNIRCVLMSAATRDNSQVIISHPGTTFAGIVLRNRTSIDELTTIISLIEKYYQSKYQDIILKLSPIIYQTQPNQLLEYLLFRNGYQFGFTALANVIELTDIKSEDDIFALYTSSGRNHVRRTLIKDLYTFQRESYIDEHIWQSINNNLTSKYKVKATHSYEEISELLRRFPTNIIPYVVYRNSGEYGAFGLVYKFKHVFHTQYLDVNYQLSNENPNYFLIHNLIKIAAEEGYRYFSFGASTENRGQYLNTSLFDFKNAFGGGSILLPMYYKVF